MIETIVLAFIIAKIKHYKLAPLLRAWPMYPFVLLELVYLFFQFSVFNGNYQYVQYAGLLKHLQIFVFIIPIIAYKQYKQAMIGSAFIFAGSFLNNFVISQNGGKMPVFPSISYLTGYVSPNSFTIVSDIHMLGSADTQWKLLADIFDMGYTIMSLGDIFISVFVGLLIYNTIKILNKRVELLVKPKEKASGE
jgi:hypothetical protein